MQISLKLGEEIKQIRNSFNNCDQKEFAKIIGITNVHLSNLEKGKKLPSEELLVRVFNTINKKVPDDIFELLKDARNENRKGLVQFTSNNVVYNLQEEGIYSIPKLKELLKVTPDNLKLIFGLLTLLKEERRVEEARRHLLQSLIHIKEDEIKRWLEASYFLLEGNYQTAIDLMTKSIQNFEKSYPISTPELDKRKAGLLFELANIFYEYGYYSYNYKFDKSLAINNYNHAFDCFEKLREIHNEPLYEMYYANVFWWLAFLGVNSKQNWESYIDKAENVLLLNHEYKMRNSLPGKSSKGLYSEPYVLQVISGLSEAFGQLAKIEIDSNTHDSVIERDKKLEYLLKQGELLLAQHAPIKILPEKKEYYNFYFSYACFYSLKAEVFSSLGKKYDLYLDLCQKGLQEAVFGDAKGKLKQYERDFEEAKLKELSFFVKNRSEELKYIKN